MTDDSMIPAGDAGADVAVTGLEPFLSPESPPTTPPPEERARRRRAGRAAIAAAPAKAPELSELDTLRKERDELLAKLAEASKGKKRAQHSADTDDWGTPREFIDIARAVLGHISVDPFSAPKWNAIIGARRIITERQDGFVTPWGDGWSVPGLDTGDGTPQEDDATALVNAPGDRSGGNVKRAWEALELYHRRGWLAGGAVWVGFTLNQLQTCQTTTSREGRRVYRSPLHRDFLRCIPDRRVGYQEAPGVVCEQPTHPSWIALLPSTNVVRAEQQRRAFAALCERLGEVF